ncbi:MAG TPA: VanW family protein [Acidimicrobiia bacterium]|nr:VanW family protein [Acidimicrobiia bacterium]
MPRALRITLISAAVPIVLWMWLGVVFAMDRASDGGEILGRVTIGDVEVGGMTANEARQAILGVEARLGAEGIPVRVQDITFTLFPSEVGFDIDEETVIAEAMRVGRDGGLTRQMQWWLGHLGSGSPNSIELPATYNRSALMALLRAWEAQAIADPPTEGGILVEAGQVLPVYPKSGTGLDFEATADLIGEQILGDRQPVVAQTEFRTPTLVNDDIDLLVARATGLISQPVTLAKILPQTSITFPTQVLAASIASRRIGTEDDPDVELFFQIGPLVQYLNGIRDTVETGPVDAQVVIRPDDVPLIIPGSNAVEVDDASLPEAIMRAASSVTRTGPLPVRDGREPEFTTADAEALGIRNLLYTATTFFSNSRDPTNQNRNINIRRIADETNGAIVMPGEVFSLNEHVGRRTLEDGYREAGAILGPIVYCCDHPANIGGGVSQFTTTLYNAVFFSGLEDVAHTPHSLYFSRYPVVREATLGWPTPDLKFRNNTENAIYIKTEYTDTSVSVKFFGDNGGITVEAETSDRSGFTEPGIYYEPDPDVPPGTEEERDDGEPGFTATVTRTITYPDGREPLVQRWTWTYDPHPIRIAVHPCQLPEDHIQYDPEVKCPVQVPHLAGITRQEAINALTSIGLVFVEKTEVTTNEDLHNTVKAQNVAPDTWLDPESEVEVTIWKYEAPPDP